MTCRTAHKFIHTSQKASWYFSITITEVVHVKPAGLSIDRNFPLSEEGSRSHSVFTDSDVTPAYDSPGMYSHLVCYRQNCGLAHKSIHTSQKVKQYFSVTGNKEVQSTPADLGRNFPLSEEGSHRHSVFTDSDVTPGNESPGMSPGLLPSKLWAC